MKMRFKKIVALLLVCLLALPGCLAAFADAEAASNSGTAYIMYADSSWTYQYWCEPVDTGVVASNADVTGEGTYTVSLDFTGTEAGAASGVAFTAVGIKDGENLFPNYTIEINEIKINGEAIEFGKGYTSSDDQVETRMNIMNEWVTALPDDARSNTGDVSDASWIIVDKAAFESVQTYEVTFTLHAPLKTTGYIMFANADWSAQYWCAPAEGVTATDAEITGEGNYTVALEFAAPSVGLAFTALGITNGELVFPGYCIKINYIMVNDTMIDYTKGYTSSDNQIETRMNIMNEWVGELPADARSHDGDISDVSWIIVDKELFAEVTYFEINFDYIAAAPADAPAAEEEEPFDAEAALAQNYNAYMAVQSAPNYTFRNEWHDASYGKGVLDADGVEYFSHLTGWDDSNNALNMGGTFTDCAIDGDGTYTVSLVLNEGDTGFANQESFNFIYVSTDIPYALFEGGHLTVSDVKTSIDGGAPRAFTFVGESGEYATIMVINTYNAEVGAEAIPYSIPTKSVEISFTISGFGRDGSAAGADEEPVVDEEPAVDEAPAKGESNLTTIIVIAATAVVLAGAIAGICVAASKKNKKKEDAAE